MRNVNDALSPELLRTLDPVCDAFERAWKRGERPVIEGYLGSVAEAVRSALRVELLHTELEWRCRLGERPTAEEYGTRFPDCAGSLPDWLAEAHSSAESLTGVPAVTEQPGVTHTETYVPVRPAEGARPPRVLGEYELLGQLGAGGMGEVHKARHRRLGKLVALKLLPTGTRPAADRLTRFLREMRAVGGLDHPNVVEAHDAGEQDGVVYLVMKLVEGTDLSALVRRSGPLPVAEACELVRQAALGLQYLHERGMVHRDIKPSNLMRTPEGAVKILDLGLARWREKASGDEELTAVGQAMGTPDYLAPEQARNATEADIRADIYGLGATLFYLLTGRAPFAHRQGIYEKLEAHRAEAPPDVRSLRPEVPAALVEVVGRLLAKRPEDRPQTPAEVAAALASFAAASSADTMLTSSLPSRQPAGRKRRRVGLAVAAAVLVLLLALALILMRRDRPREQTLSPTVAGGGGEGVPEKVRVVSLDVLHFANEVDDNGEKGDRKRGLLGVRSFAAHFDDGVTIQANLSRPAYAYLIAFRPDGTDEVCFPEKEDEPPSLTDQPRYPTVKPDDSYGLTEGEGLQVFALVVASKPLPAYKEWRAQRGESPWKKHKATPGVVWRDDGSTIEARTADDANGTRGKGRKVSDKSPLAELTDWLRQDGQVEAVAAVGFAVLPKRKP